MIGKLLSKVVKVATLPVAAVNIVADKVTGGDGSKTSRMHGDDPISELENVMDQIADAAEAIDE